MRIKAAVARAAHAPLTLETLELEQPRDDEILVRVVATGVCHTDIAMRDQVFPVPQPVVLGHEGAGIVDQVGRSVTKVVPGDHVVMTFNSCGQCPTCLDHASVYCHHGRDLNFGGQRRDGTTPLKSDAGPVHGNFFGQSSFAEFVLCNQRNAIKVDPDADLAALGPLACGIQTGAGAVVNALRVGVGSSIAVFGAGSVGLSAIMAAKLVGAATIIAVDRNAARLELASELGATHTLDAGLDDAPERIVRLTGTGVDFAFEATGNPAVVGQAIASLGMRGVCGMVGSFPPGATLEVELLHLLVGGRSLRGIVVGETNPDVFIPRLIDLNRQGRFPYDRLLSYFDFDDINAAIAAAEEGSVVKPVLRMVWLPLQSFSTAC